MLNNFSILLTGISIRTILYYYAILCLFMTPLMFAFIVYISRRTNIFEKFDAFIEKFLPPEKEEKKYPNEEKPLNNNSEPASEQQIQAQSGIAAFEIKVGESYQCHLNYQNRGGSYGGMIWYNDNEFIGKVNENGLFRGAKAGISNIFCVSKGHSFEAGVQAYAISVIATDSNWFMDRYIKDVIERRKEIDVLAANVKNKIITENPSLRIITYAGNPTEGTKSMSIQLDELKCVSRILFRLHRKETLEERLYQNLNERFDEVKLKKTNGLRIWVHEIIDREHDEVDVYAFAKETSDGCLLVGIGQTWREYGEREEFVDNIRLALRQFIDIIPDEMDDDVEALKEPEAPTNENNENIGDSTGEAPETYNDPEEHEPEKPSEPAPEEAPEQTAEPEPETSIDEYEDYSE